MASDAAAYRLIVENAVDLVVRADARWRRRYVSPSARELLGYEPAEMIGAHGLELVHPDDLPSVRAAVGRVGAAEPRVDVTFRMRRKDERYIWMAARYRYLAEDGGLVAMLRDITPQHEAKALLAEANARLERANTALLALANLDGLTGLANRRRFDEVLALEFRRARRHELPLALVLLDIDRFKLFNDHQGHLAGDDCLRAVAGAVGSSVRRPGDAVARFGGEELVAVLPATELAGAVVVAERMRAAVEGLGLGHPGSGRGVVTLSAGVSCLLPIGGQQPADLIRAADTALYAAKAAGRNCVRAADLCAAVAV